MEDTTKDPQTHIQEIDAPLIKNSTLWNRIKSVFDNSNRELKKKREHSRKAEKYREMYERFREILTINDSTLEFISQVEDRLSGRKPFVLESLIQKTHKAVIDVFSMVNNLNQIGDGRYFKLYDAINRIKVELESEISKRNQVVEGPFVIQVSALRASDAALAGGKMATLGEVKRLGFNIPDGFVITTNAYIEFMKYNDLLKKIAPLEEILQAYNPRVLDRACRDLQVSILEAKIPPALEKEIMKAHKVLAGSRDILVAVRSSAVEEDGTSSHAGQYFTELEVPQDLILDSYRNVVASPYKMEAALYRYERGLNDGQTMMAVGCLEMVDPLCSGVMFSRQFDDHTQDRVVISATPGLNVGITSGSGSAEEIVLSREDYHDVSSSYINRDGLIQLRNAARSLEQHFGAPQDIEWALDKKGKLFILQSRPMSVTQSNISVIPENAIQSEPILTGGYTGCPGAGSGAVFHIIKDDDMDIFPTGGVVVAKRSSPTLSRVMSRCAAIVTEVGSPVGHMAILAREFNVPTIVGMNGAMAVLTPGREVTVDAALNRIYDGAIKLDVCPISECAPLADSPVVHRLRRISRFITPLRLTDPKSPEFIPSGCKSLHDITRFVHEKVYEIMFRFGKRAEQDQQNSYKLDAYLPIQIMVFDVGGGVTLGAGDSGVIKPEDVLSVPLKAFLEGLLDSRIKWDHPRPISARGFLSVLGENMAGLPATTRGVGSASFVVMSDRYMNFSTKAGYHFSTVDVYCGKSINKNYIHFRFEGGGAAMDRRLRRIQFIMEVLTKLGFNVQQQGDFLVARLDKYEFDYIQSRLTDLGRLTMCSRQLDMLMGSDEIASQLARAFLNGEMEMF